VKLWSAKVTKLNASGKRIVVDDVRFQNEVETVLSRQGVMWKIDRPGTVKINHLSEQLKPADECFDFLINNDSTVEQLEQCIITQVKGYKPCM
jgi:hypothetical protein